MCLTCASPVPHLCLACRQRDQGRVAVRAPPRACGRDGDADAGERGASGGAGDGLPARKGCRGAQTQLEEHLPRSEGEALSHRLRHGGEEA